MKTVIVSYNDNTKSTFEHVTSYNLKHNSTVVTLFLNYYDFIVINLTNIKQILFIDDESRYDEEIDRVIHQFKPVLTF